ncbi:MAG TPA: MFS transporter [Chitinophagaceae bacterium]|nr:MFS transporter [Chitinophagaceae bacterium]
MPRIFKIYSQSFSGLSREAWLLSIVMLINRMGSMVLPFLGVYMVDKLGFSLIESGWVLSAFGLGGLIGSFLGGRLTDKFGAYSVQTMSLLLSVPFYCLLPLFTSVGTLALMIFILSIIVEMFRPANSVAITQFANPENITRAFSLNRMAVNLGFSFGPAVGGLLAAISYNFMFFANAASVLIALIVYVSFFKKRKNTHCKNQEENKNLTINGKEIKERNPYFDLPFVLFCLFCTFFSICFFQIFNSLPLFYKESLGMSTQSIGLVLGFSGFVIVLLEMLIVYIAERKFTINQTMLIGTLFCVFAFASLIIVPNLFLVYVSIFLLSMGEILVLPFMSTITAIRSTPKSKGRYMGLNGAAVAVAFIISPYLGTFVAQDLGFQKLWIGTVALLLITMIGFYMTIKKLV